MMNRETAAIKETFTAKDMELTGLEARISEYMQGACRNIIAVGRCLNEAKDRKLVPHGEWEDWVIRNTGMSARRAQRIMQAAREVPEGSYLTRLPVTKITMLLALPEGEREDFAQEIDAESMTSRQLEDAVKARKILTDRLRDARKQNQEMQTRIDEMKHQTAVEVEDAVARAIKEKDMELARLQDETDRKIGEMMEMRLREREASDDAEKEELRREIERLEAEITRRGESETEVKRQLMEVRRQLYRTGDRDRPGTLDPGAVRAAVESFIARVAVLPEMDLADIESADRISYTQSVNTVMGWCERSLTALSVVHSFLEVE